MKKYLCCNLCLSLLLFLLTACSNDEDLKNSINFDSPYVITDDPNDPIQHQRYLLYQKYCVPVFFNDTISQKMIGIGYDGKPIYQYETLDFNWSFSSHNKGKVDYVTEYLPSEYWEKALQFAESFLQEASKPMRPFSIFFPKDFTIVQNDEEVKEPYWVGFRTLVIPNVQDIAPKEISEFSHNILISMVKDKIWGIQSIVDSFGEISDPYYGREWVSDLGCHWGVEHKGTAWKPSELFNEGIMEKYINSPFTYNVLTEEEFLTERTLIFDQIGQFGFICGADWNEHLNSPEDVQEDLDFYLDTMLAIGEKTFLERYSRSSLVVKKYNLLANYIRNELGVDF